MKRKFFKSIFFVVAIGLLLALPAVQSYMLGCIRIGTCGTDVNVEQWYKSGFYAGRTDIPHRYARLHSTNAYYVGSRQGRAYRASLFQDKTVNTFRASKGVLISGRRIIGDYSINPKTRRGRYYTSCSRLAVKDCFRWTGSTSSQRSRLTMSLRDLELLHEESSREDPTIIQ